MKQQTPSPIRLNGHRNGRGKRRARTTETATPSLPSETDLVLARFRLRARIRAAWLQTLLSKWEQPPNGTPVSHGEIALLLSDADSPEAEQAWAAAHEIVSGWSDELHALEKNLQQWDANGGRLARLMRIFGIEPAERDLLEACFAVAADSGLARVCVYLHNHAGRPFVTEDLAARMYGHGRRGSWTAESAVFRWQLIQRSDRSAGESAAMTCDPQIRDWIMNRHALDEELLGIARIQAPPEPLRQWPITETAAWLEQAIRKNPGIPLRLIVSGPSGSGRKSFAAVVARQLRLPLLVIDADGTDDAAWPTVFLHAQRQAFLDSCALAWTGDTLARRPWPARSATFPIQFCLCSPGAEPPPAPEAIERRLLLPAATTTDRVRLWREHVPMARSWPEKLLQKLAAEHPVHPGDIVQAGRNGVANPADAARCARESARTRFNGLVQRLECPFNWDDLVVPPAVREGLETIAYEARHRHRFWEDPANRRLFPQGRGLTALLSGLPGTGKTMAAQVITASLGQDLFRVNLAHLVSKWVGETAKNIDSLLHEAAALDAVVFFDEAEAAFAKRSTEMRDAQDRFANTDAAHLLQAIENYPGVVLLATNLKANIDPAFFRRLRYVIEFPKPEAALQRTLWLKLIGAMAGLEAVARLAPAIESLSTTVDVTGAQIKFAILNAVFAAHAENKPVQVRHLLDGLNRELGKEGRTVGLRERERIPKMEAAK